MDIDKMGTGDRGYSPVRRFGEKAGPLLSGCAGAPNKHRLKENDLVWWGIEGGCRRMGLDDGEDQNSDDAVALCHSFYIQGPSPKGG